MSAKALELSLDSDLARDVISGLGRSGQKSLPSTYLYDELGSILFDAITVLPEYGLTRADARLLRRYSGTIVGLLPGQLKVAELGSGTGAKTRWVLEAVAARNGYTEYLPIDISPTALEKCRYALGGMDSVEITPIHADYLKGLQQAVAQRGRGESLLLLFLGSTIGNFDYQGARSFIAEVRNLLGPGDALLLGADLIKPLRQMIPAYDDACGVTAAFNLNVLQRINRELGADFHLRNFAHEARFNAAESRIEMHLRALITHTVTLRSLGYEILFRAGETIWTEGSYKFRREEIIDLGRAGGFEVSGQWVDGEWPFAETLLTVPQ